MVKIHLTSLKAYKALIMQQEPLTLINFVPAESPIKRLLPAKKVPGNLR